MWERASSSRSSRATGDCILPSVACFPPSSFFFLSPLAAFCEALHVDPGHLRPLNGHRGRGVDSGGERRRVVPVKLTFEKMAAIGSPASSSTQRTHRRSSVGRGTVQSRCGTCQTANASRLSPDIGEPPLRNVACLPRYTLEGHR